MLNKIRDRVAVLQFWWAKKRLTDGVDYTLHITDDILTVELLKGKFAGVKFRYDRCYLRDNMSFEFHTVIVDNPNNENVTSKKFNKLSANLFRVILSECMSDSSKVINENRTSDTDEPDQEREFYEEVSPILEKRVSKRQSRKKVVPADSGIYPEIQQPAKQKRAATRTPRKTKPK